MKKLTEMQNYELNQEIEHARRYIEIMNGETYDGRDVTAGYLIVIALVIVSLGITALGIYLIAQI